ncbi:hypothetical protein [Pedobacter paludis]|uniref:Uncharacterized protein n=1 Tax=Pedobacter paludis TaxID=2203212 RepID=A0A317F2C1_9SPHI|nr:hypothetical protein [Pedobacter paludis]PWS33331.1 hypothetical protein DF947_01515 [Pedobacter paludis]
MNALFFYWRACHGRLNFIGWSIVVLLCAFMGCGKLQPAISGMYVNHAGSEMSIARDTLVVELAHDQQYLIHRRTGFRLIATGKPGPWQYEKEEWSGVFDAASGVLTEKRNGKLITFDLERGLMVVGKRKYERVSDK